MAKNRITHSRRKHSLFYKLKHWLEKRGQGLPMTTIVIIMIVLIVLAVVVVFFFGQFSTGQKAVEGQQQLGTDASFNAKCNAWATKIIPKFTGFENCSLSANCTASCNKADGAPYAPATATARPAGCTTC